MKTLAKTLAIAIIVTTTLCVGATHAQLIQNGPNGWTVQQQQQYVPQQAQQFNHQQQYPQQQMGTQFPNPYSQSTPYWALRQHPMIVTRNQQIGVDPYTGAPITRNEQVSNTYFDPTRNAMRNNGTQQFVQRPVYNSQGQITGYEQGYTWRNTITGAEHHELKTTTIKPDGSKHIQDRVGF